MIAMNEHGQLMQERQRQELDNILKLDRMGMHEVAEFFAADLGLTKEFQQEKSNA